MFIEGLKLEELDNLNDKADNTETITLLKELQELSSAVYNKLDQELTDIFSKSKELEIELSEMDEYKNCKLSINALLESLKKITNLNKLFKLESCDILNSSDEFKGIENDIIKLIELNKNFRYQIFSLSNQFQELAKISSEHNDLLHFKLLKLDKNISENEKILEHIKSDVILEEAIKLKEEALEFIEEKLPSYLNKSDLNYNLKIIKAVSLYEVVEQDYSDLNYLHKNLDNKYYKLNNQMDSLSELIERIRLNVNKIKNIPDEEE